MIRAAGLARYGPVAAVPAGVLENMIDLNDRAAVSLVQAVPPYCHAGSHLVQICSCAAFLPIPELAVYAATKAFSYATAGHWPWNWHRRVSSYSPFVRIG